MRTSVPSASVFWIPGLTGSKTRYRLDSEVVNEIMLMNKVPTDEIQRGKSQQCCKSGKRVQMSHQSKVQIKLTCVIS